MTPDRLPEITPSVCQRCGTCCSAVIDGELVAFRHLDVSDGFRCAIYATMPQVCRDYSCVRDGRLSDAVEGRALAALEEAA